MKKVVIATPIFPPEIAEPAFYIKKISKPLSEKYKISIVAFSNFPKTIPDTKIIPINKNKIFIFRFSNYIKELYKESKNAEVIYSQNAVASGLPSVIVGYLLKIPVIIRFIGDEAWERATQLKLTEKNLEDFLLSPEGGIKIKLIILLQGFVLRRAESVIVPSKYVGKIISDIYKIPKNKIHLNYNPPEDIEKLPFETKPIKNQIITISKLTKWEHVSDIIKATEILKKEFNDIKLIIAGKDSEKQKLEKLTKELGLTDNVIFMGRISRAESWYLQKTSQARIFNSFHEDTPDTVINSFTAEIPTIVVNSPSINEIIYNEQSGLLFKQNDPEDLANSIKKIIQNNTLREKIISGSKKLVEKNFSLESHINKLINIFDSLDK